MMAITSVLAFLYMRSRGWSLAVAVPLFGFFALVDLIFLSANLLKIAEGGWFPTVVAALVLALMGTWWRGRRLRRLANGARYVTSVCTGSLALGAAGLLHGNRAARNPRPGHRTLCRRSGAASRGGSGRSGTDARRPLLIRRPLRRGTRRSRPRYSRPRRGSRRCVRRSAAAGARCCRCRPRRGESRSRPG